MITSTLNVYEIAAASGSDTDYTFPYPIHKSTDLLVYVNGVKKLIGDSTYGHSVTVAANKQTALVEFNTAPLLNDVLKFERELEYKQETDLANNSLFDAESLESALDNIVMQVQQVGIRSTDLVFGFDPGIAKGDYNDSDPQAASTLNEVKADRANKALAFDADGDITISSDDIDNTIDYQLEAKEWASLASGNVYDYTDGARDSDQGSISAKAQAAAAAASAASALTHLEDFTGQYHGSTSVTPSSGVGSGDLWFDSTGGVLQMKVYDGSSWVRLTPSSAEQTAINAVNADAVDIGKCAAIDDEIEDCAAIDTEIGQLAVLGTAGAHISTVAAITAGDISKVAIITTGDVSKVAAITTGDVSKVAVITTGDVSKVAVITTGDVSKVAAITTGDVSKVAVITTGDVSKVAAVDGEVADVAAIDTEITTLINGTDGTSGTGGTTKNILLVNSVHGKITEVGNLGTATVVGYMTALNGTNVITHMANLNATNIITYIGNLNAAGVITNIGNLNAAGVISNIAALNAAGVIADIGDVADVDAEITLLGTVAMATATTGHLARLGTADVVADMILLGATGVIGDIETVADNLTNIDNFKDLYQISNFSPPPSTDGGGNAIAIGDIAFDSTANVLKICNGVGPVTFASVSSVTEVSSDTTPVLGGNLDVNDKIITTSSATGHIAFDKGVTEKIGTSAMPGGTTVITVDLATGNFFEVDLEGLNGNVLTFTISNADATSSMVNNFVIKIIQGTTTTTRNFTWATIVSNGTNIDWAGGAGPDITTGDDNIDILSFTSYDQGTTWYGAIVGQDFG